jgi:hypothetical protein
MSGGERDGWLYGTDPTGLYGYFMGKVIRGMNVTTFLRWIYMEFVFVFGHGEWWKTTLEASSREGLFMYQNTGPKGIPFGAPDWFCVCLAMTNAASSSLGPSGGFNAY